MKINQSNPIRPKALVWSRLLIESKNITNVANYIQAVWDMYPQTKNEDLKILTTALLQKAKQKK